MKDHQLLQYKGYCGSINIDSENNLLYGKVEFIRALITYEAKDVRSLIKAFHESIDNYLAFCNEQKIEAEQPFKGSLNVRIGKERHRKTWLAARSLDKSLNEYICQALDESFQTKAQKSLSSKNIKKNVLDAAHKARQVGGK